MRVSQEEKVRSHARIVDNAARLFREHGVEGASVGDVMKAAGLTHGGFYRHFPNKDALLVAALDAAFAQMTAPLEAGLKESPPAVVRQAFRSFYLSDDHLADPGAGCPAAALSGDVARASIGVKDAFGSGVNSMIGVLSLAAQPTEPSPRAQATRELAMMVGALMLARASDAATAEAILSACRVPEAKAASKLRATKSK